MGEKPKESLCKVMASQKTYYFLQCKLEKSVPEVGIMVMITWIPVEYAKIGKMLKLKKEVEENWEEEWEVREVYEKSKPLIEATLASKNYRNWRECAEM